MKQIFSIAFLSVLFSTVIVAQDASFPLEANGGYIDFNGSSNFKDTWYVGGATGFNFTENAGLRGYYWKALDDGDITNLDELEIYGLETRVQAPITENFRPYIVVGGGLIKPYTGYVGKDGLPYTDNKFFGSAGAGLDLRFINFLSLTGYARAMVSEFDQLDNLNQDNTSIEASWNYGASLNFRIGDHKNRQTQTTSSSVPMPEPKAEATPVVTENKEQKDSEVQDKIEQKMDSDDKTKRISELEQRLQQLEDKIEREEELEKLRKEIREEMRKEFGLDETSKKKMKKEESKEEKSLDSVESKSSLKTKSEVEEASDKAKTEVEEATESTKTVALQTAEATNDESLNESKAKTEALAEQVKALEDQESQNAELKKRLDQLNDRIESLQNQQVNTQRALETQRSVNTQRSIENTQQPIQVVEPNSTFRTVEVGDAGNQKKVKVKNNRLSFSNGPTYFKTNLFGGYGFGDNGHSAFIFGARPEFQFANSQTRFAPEAGVGLGGKTTVNVLGNLLFDLGFDDSTILDPYLGVGAGVIVPDGDFKFAYNFILGTDLKKVLNGKFNAEFGTRNLFDYNQVSLGYHLF